MCVLAKVYVKHASKHQARDSEHSRESLTWRGQLRTEPDSFPKADRFLGVCVG